MIDTKKQSLLKTILYRFISSLLTVTFVFIMSKEIKLSGYIGLYELILKPILYYLFERLWIKKHEEN